MRLRLPRRAGRTGPGDGTPRPADRTPGDRTQGGSTVGEEAVDVDAPDEEAIDALGGTGGRDAIDDIIDAAIGRTIDSLPVAFREQLGSVAIVVEDEPTPDQLAAVGVAGMFGLYLGVPRTRFEAGGAPVPSKITLFRATLLLHHPDLAALDRAVEDTLLHELAHHFGIGDDRLRELRHPG